MAHDDDKVVGFSPSDAKRLLSLITIGETPVRMFRQKGGVGGQLYVARLNAAWVSNAADADIYDIDGATITDSGVDETVYDPLGIFSTLGVDDYLKVIRQGGKLIALQAPCTG